MTVPLPDGCGFATALLAIGGKWKPAILWELTPQPLRFGQLRRCLPGISEKVLTQQLREMEANGLIRRADLSGAVRHVEYSVTEVGRSLNDAVEIMSAWGRQQERRLAGAEATREGLAASGETAAM